MKKIYLLAFIVIGSFLQSQNAFSQCTPATPWVGYLPFTEDATFPVAYAGYMCQGHDSIYTRPGWAYFDGDGYPIRLLAGSQVTVYVDSCLSTANSSITIVDSQAINLIPGAFSAAACPNSLSFTAPYDGLYYIVFDTDNDCSTAGLSAMGTASVKLNNAASFTNCNPFQPVNDLICGAIGLTLNTLVGGDNTNATASDADDATLLTAGYLCFAPNNTVWYSYTPATSDSVDIFFGTDVLNNSLAGWFGVLSTSGTCAGPFAYDGCYYGPLNATASGNGAAADPWGGVIPTADSTANHIYLTGGTNYYFVIDGVAGDVGAFTFGIRTWTPVGVHNIANNLPSITVYPNPSLNGYVTVANSNNMKDVELTVFNAMGQSVYSSMLQDHGNTKLDLSTLASGIYSFQFKSNEGTGTRKVVIQNQN